MGGGEVYPSAATIQQLLKSASEAEIQGQFALAAERYRAASTLVTSLMTSQGITEDERYSLELQSKEFLDKAVALENQATAQVPIVQPQTESAENVAVDSGEGQASVEASVEAPSRTSDETGACVVGATGGLCVGSILGIPLIGAVAGGVFGGVAAAREDEYGHKARKIGRYGANMVDRTVAFNREHNVTGNIKVGAESLLYKAKEMDKKHNIVGNVANATSTAWNKAVELEKEHNLGEKAMNAAKAGYNGMVNMNEKYGISAKVEQKISNMVKPPSQSQSGQSSFPSNT